MDRTCIDCGNGCWGKRCQPCADDARRRPGERRYGRLVRIYNCSQCRKRFESATGNRVCASCQHRARKHPCKDCGTECDKRATFCNVCRGKRGRGSNAPGWQGGRIIHGPSGYMLLKMPEHPNARKDGYVREHIVVMESVLGRYLRPGENVHHLNGVKHDNRPENLELWTRNQPAGQRVSDLLTWAREIIDTYECEEALL